MRGMNGSSGASPDNRTYPGIPAPVVPPMGLGMGMGPGGAAAPGLGLHSSAAHAAAAAGLGGPELKHHADFLSRLLAATPSYMSEMGNPPPGFFSDWLRRLVSKPTGSTSQSPSGLSYSGGGGGPPEGESGSRSNAPTSTPSLDAQISSKRRKRSRLSDHLDHPLGGRSSSSSTPGNDGAERPAPHHTPTSSSSQGQPLPPHTSSASSPPSSAQIPSGSTGFPGLGAYPFWFLPPFLPNPYGMGMNMGMNFPGHPGGPGSGAPGMSAAAQAAAISSYLGGASPSDLFRTDNLNLLSGSMGRGGAGASPHHPLPPFPPPPQSLDPTGHYGHPQLSKLSATGRILEGKGKESPPVPRSPSASSMKDSSSSSFLAAAAAAASASFLLSGNGGGSSSGSKMGSGQQQLPSPSSGSHYGGNNHNGVHHHHHSSKMSAKSPPNKSKGFSISRLTSPSPSSNSSGGSGSGNSSKYRAGHHHRSGTSSYEDVKPQVGSGYKGEESVLKSNLNSGPKMGKDDAGLCVDLRVSGRIWESSGSSGVAPAPRSVYTPLSAFRDPADNLYNSSQVPRYDPHHHTDSYPQPPPSLPLSLMQQPRKTPPLSGFPSPQNATSAPNNNGSSAGGVGASGKNLSTKYVLRNIQHIYQRIRPTPTSSPAASPNPNQITTSHPINNHHSPPALKLRSPLSSQTSINHHHPLHPDNKHSSTLHNKSKKTNGDSTSPATNNNKDDSPPDSENEDNNIIIPDSRPHSSSSSSLDDDDFKPEAELKMAIKDNTLNLTLNNNVEKGGMELEVLNKLDHQQEEESKADTAGESNSTKKRRRKSAELAEPRSQNKKRKSSVSSDKSSREDGRKEMMRDDNPYHFEENDEESENTSVSVHSHTGPTTPTKGNSKGGKNKGRRENNNEVMDEPGQVPSNNKKIKISIAKVKSESGDGGEEENYEMVNTTVSEQDGEEEALEC